MNRCQRCFYLLFSMGFLISSTAVFAQTHIIITKRGFELSQAETLINQQDDISHYALQLSAFKKLRILIVDLNTADKAALDIDPNVAFMVEDFAINFDMPSTLSNEGDTQTDLPEPPFTGDDDFFFDFQWNHDAIDTVSAWDMGYRGQGARVAILDTGIDAEHPDLVDNLNTDLSISFVPGEGWNNLPTTRSSHGTQVAGIIAAADNAYGIIGVAPEAEILAVKVLSETTGTGTFASLFLGMFYAIENNADIINLSLGAKLDKSEPDVKALIHVFSRLVHYAKRNRTTVVSAVGNDALEIDDQQSTFHFPAQLRHVIAAGATGPTGWGLNPEVTLDDYASYSNSGQRLVDFVAPGGNDEGLGTDLEQPCFVNNFLLPCYTFDGILSTDNNRYTWNTGTSLAAAHVSGVAALIISKYKQPLKPRTIRWLLKRGSQDLGDKGRDNFFGYGQINAAKTLAPWHHR